MKNYTYETGVNDFLRFVVQQKKAFQKWCYVYFYAVDPSQVDMPFDELIQFTNFYFKSVSGSSLTIKHAKELVFLLEKGSDLLIKTFEKEFIENFPTSQIRAEIRSLDGIGIQSLCKIISRAATNDNKISSLQLTRIARDGNCMMIMDDDPMITKQLEKLLSSYGMVVALNKADDFFELYKQYVPDILFLDIHLRESMGNDMLRKLIKTIDPDAYVVMISSDTEASMVKDIKSGGAKSFIMKPFDRTIVVQHLLKAPTIVQKIKTV